MKLLETIMIFFLQTLCKIFTHILFNIFYRTRYYHAYNIPKTGGFVMAPNHASFFDPPLIGSATFFRIFRFMARDTLFKPAIAGLLITWMGAFPIKRGSIDRKSWDTFVRIVKSGECVMLFPEATRTPDGELQPGKPWAGMLIYKARAVVVPVYTHGIFDAWPKGHKMRLFKRINIIYGEPMDLTEYFNLPESKEVYTQIVNRVMEQIHVLKKELLDILAAEKK